MVLSGSRQLEQLIREEKLPGLLLLYGEDGLSITRAQRKLEKLAVTAFPDFNSYRCDGKAPVDLDALADSVLSLPVMAPRRFALVDDLDPELLSAQDLEKLRQLGEERPEESLLVITVRSAELDPKKKGSKGGKLFALCDEWGAACPFPRPTPQDAARAAMAEAAKLGSSMDQKAALLLAEYCGRDSLRMQEEARKLAAYAPEGISPDTVKLLVAPVTEARVFDLSDKIVAGDLSAALGAIDDLCFLRESPVTILSILSMAFVDMYRAAAARKAGIPPAEAKKAYGYGGSGYRYDKGVQNQRRFSVPQLEDILRLLERADGEMKQSGAEPRTVLETAVAEIFRRMGAD